MKTIITWLKRAAMLAVMAAFAAAGLGANAATSLTLNDGDTLTGVYEDYEITIAAGATVTLNGATITRSSGGAPAVNCLGDATIILAPGSVNVVTNTVGGYSCVRPAENATLTIRGSGTLTAAGGYNAAAIGSGSGQNGTCGSIVIKGGTIEAFGGTTGAGIGSGNSGTCGSIVIEGGTVTAQGGDWSAGIGSAYNGTCGDITISGGTVTAEVDRSTSDNMTCTAAIGAGCRGTCGNILISGGTVVADAHSGYSRDDACAIGATYTNGKCGDITLTTGITSLTATKGATAQQYIGQGDGSATVGRIYGMLRFDKEYSNDGNTVTLTPKASFESYTVTWKNDDGTTADTTSVEYGLLPSHAGLTKTGDGYLEYLFAGWTPEFAEVESNVAYTAVFIAVPAVRSTGDDAEWFVDADEGALRSGVIGDNQNTWLRTSLPRPCVFSFKWKTSSETGCDNLHFTVNGAYVLDTEGRQVATISGVGNDWTTVSVVISNSLDVLEWKYGKDGSAVSGQDCGWVKDFEMATFDGEIRSLSVVPNYDGLATVTAYAAKDVVMDVFPPLARHGYALLGYFTAAEGGELVEPPYALSADTTLYAHWAKTTDFDTSDPTAEWTIEDDGITWRTGAIGHSTNTWATYTVKRPCTVTYKWKTSTEANNDPLVFYVDDVEQSRISGESADWVDVSLSFEDSKNHVLKWVYSKDWSDTGRYDCGWIRDFVVTPYDSWAVTRDLNYEGATELETRYVKKGSQLDVSEFPPSDEPREGYSCSWAMAPWSGDALSAPVDISADTTLYAHWIKQYGFDEIDTTCQEPWTWLDDGSIRTGKIGDSGETWVTISVTGPCDVSFKWMTSSESGWDKLHFYVDDSHKIEISGVTPEWESYTASVGSGDHVLKWTYTKDGGGAFGEDCGWVKDIVITAPDSAPYTVTWKNADGTTLETDADLEAGAAPVYNSALPTLAATAQYTYEFAGWEPEFELVSSNTTYTAKYTAMLRSYDVTWQKEDCTPLGATNIFYGATPTYSGATPVKPATPKFTYTFAGWDPEVAAVTGEATYTATYDATINKYTITWQNDDGTVIDSADVAYDETPSHAAPAKASTAQYDYEFAGWSPAVASVTGEATYTATFTPILRSYTITWLNEDGTALDTSTVEYGATPSHAAPTKASTAQYDYTFTGWGNVVVVSGEATYQATFTPVLRSYTVSWVVEGETVASGAVEYGTTPAYSGATPVKESTAEYDYTFAGWGNIVAVTGAATYTAQFNATKRSYTITWLNEGGAVLASGDVEYGTVPAYGGATPTKAETAEYTYTFSGWSPTVSTVTDEATYTAQFNATKRSYMVSWVVEGATVASGTVEYGTTPIYDGDTPTKESTAEYSYTFTGWSPTVSTVTGEATYTAQFNATKRSYTITWANIDGEGASATSTVEHGTTPTYGGETPTKAADAQYTYTFAGWTPAVAAVTGDTVYTATFTPVTRSYTVTWVVEGETVASGAVEYGQTPTYDGDTPTKAADAQYTYEFAGWTPAVAAVTGDATYTAQFNATPKDIPVENVLFSEDFDTASLAPGLTMTVVGSFKSYPGIKAGLGTDDSGAFSFGRSTCGSSAFDNYMTTLTLDFGKETYVTRIEFDEMERYGDWGSQGRILVDGTVVDGLTFTKPGSAGYGNSRVADSEFRHKPLTLERSLTTLALQVYDITTESEEFIDNLRVYGYGDGTVTVTWRNEDGTILEADKNVALGTMPTYDGATPTKAADAQYTYEFVGWEPAVAAVTGDTVYTATFTPVTRSYTVTWVVEGETVASGTVEYGQTPSYGGETPTKESTAQYDYEFTGWGDVVAVTGDATYMAVFTPVTRSYNVTWVVDGMTVASGTVEYGATPVYGGDTPTKAETAEYSYEFTGWTPVVAAVTGDATYTAQFNSTKRSYTITWANIDGAGAVATSTVEYGTVPAYGGATPVKESTAEYTYEFTGWGNVVAVTGEATYTAQFEATKRSYTITWVVEGASVASGTVEYGTTPVYNGATPTKPEDENYTYTFNGWTPAVVAVIGNATYTATFTATPKETEDPEEPYEGTETIEGIAWSYTVANGEATITGAQFAEGTITIPETVNDGVHVVAIEPSVLADNQDITEVTISRYVVRIGADVGVKSADWAQNLEEAGFDGSYPAFGNCESLMDYKVDPSNEVFEEIGGALYYRNTPANAKELALYPSGRSTLYFADGLTVTKIGDGACAWCHKFTELTIPASVREIGVRSFDFCREIVTLAIPATVTDIGWGAFLMNIALENADINGTGLAIGDYAFYHSFMADNAGNLVIRGGVKEIGFNAFCHSMHLGSVVIEDGVTNIAMNAFSQCYDLSTVTLPDTLTAIGAGAFCGCSELREIIVPLSVDEIGLSQQDDGSDGGAFAGCYALARIYLPLSLKPATAEETNAYLSNVFNGLGLENMSAAEIAEILTWYSDPSEIGGGDEPGEPYDGTETIDGIEWSYTVANGEATITGVSALSGDVVIPATVAGGVPVTAIADYMDYRLRYNEDITSVTIPASVTNIGEGNLQSCTALETITVAGGNATYASDDGILYDVDKTVLLVSPGGKTVVTNMPESVVEIASGAFEGSRVQFCMMAQYATNIAERAFSGCSYLSTATIGKHIRNIGAYAFENCGNIRVVNFASDSECEVIGVGAFSGCEKLQKVTIPDSVIVIRGGAFSGCSELFDVTIGSGVAQIGDATVPHYIDEWGDDATMDFDPAFGNCANLRDFKVSKDNAIYEAIDGCIYYRSTPNTAKTLAVYPSGRGDLHFYGGVTVTAIGEGACSCCNKLKKLTIPQSVKDIGIEAFAHCEGVTNVYIQANSVTNISFGAFAWNMNTMDVEVAGSVRTVGEWAFMHNFGPYNLNDDFTTGQLVLHEGIREIGRGAFERCFRIGEIEIPRSVQRMGESAFADTRLARRIVIGNGLRVIPESAFECSWGSKLSELIIGNNVVGIGACAFSGCEKLRNLNIPSAVWDIGDNAFSGCTSLCALNLPSNLKSIGAGAFGGSSYGMMMSSARSLLGIGAQTFDGCTDLRRVLVPNSVTNIGVGAFGAVTSENLDRIYLPSSLKSADDSDTLAFLADQFPGLNLGIGDVTWYDDESELNYVTVTFDPNNGGETWSEQVLDYLDALPVPVTNGYAFAGWWTTSDDSGEKITISRHFSVDTTLYAHWIETSVTFGEDAPWTAVYDDYYGEWVLQSGDVAFGHTSSASMTVTGPCIVEFNFMNYMDEWGTSNDIELLVDGEMVEYYGIFNWKSATYEIPDAGEHTVTWRYVNLNGSFNDYARLRNFSATPAVAHTVTFNLEGGTMAEATSRQVLRSLGALPIPVKAGYIFNGWWWTDGDGFAERVSADFAVEDDVELVARWEKSPFSAVGGDASWFLDENGDYRTEAIGKDATVWTELRFKGPANISFSYKTSMSWMSDDHFEFVVDGERAVYQGGSSSWRSYSAAFSDDAEHVVRWVVRRNDYGDDDYEAENCVWLTYLNLPEAIIAVETPDQPPVVVDDTKMEEPVENGDGTRTIAAKEGETLTQSDVASVTVASPVDPAIDITAAYTKTLVDNTIVLQLAVPALEDVPEVEDDDEDPSGMLDDVDDIDDGKIAAMPEPDVSDPEPEKREEVGALPIKMYPGLYYQASWGDDLNNLTSGAKFRADGSQTHIGVIKQTGSRGFYKISVSER